jgi:hypothetical protein
VIGAFIKIFLMASGCLFWIALCMAVWLECRSRRYLTKHPGEWPEPVFRLMLAQSPGQLEILYATLRRDAARLGEAIRKCRQGEGLIAIEDMAIRDEINKSLVSSGLMIVEKE